MRYGADSFVIPSKVFTILTLLILIHAWIGMAVLTDYINRWHYA